MTRLTINDLSRANDLDAADMAAVSGGSGYCMPLPCYGMPTVKFDYDPSTFSLDATQSLTQGQSVVNNNGNNVAFASGISSTVNPIQHGSNNITL
jgi:hypothetical protein